MDSIPAELLGLQSRLDAWRAERAHKRQQIPDDLRQAILELSDRYEPSLLRRILNIDPWKLKRNQVAKRPMRTTTRTSPQTAFFKLPPIAPPPVVLYRRKPTMIAVFSSNDPTERGSSSLCRPSTPRPSICFAAIFSGSDFHDSTGPDN